MTDTQPMTAFEAREAANSIDAGFAGLLTNAECAATLRAYADLLDRNNVQELHITPDMRGEIKNLLSSCYVEIDAEMKSKGPDRTDCEAIFDDHTDRILALFQQQPGTLSAAVDETIAIAAEATPEPDDVREAVARIVDKAITRSAAGLLALAEDLPEPNSHNQVICEATDRILALRGGAKALGWVDVDEDECAAETPFGKYRVIRLANGKWCARSPLGLPYLTLDSDEEAAKAAAERHWQQAYREAGE